MPGPVTVLLVGIGGYGEAYVSALLDEAQGARCRIVGAVDPEPASCTRLADLRSRGIPTFASLDLFFKEGTADLAVISSPIQLHAEHVESSLLKGCHVLVEKPAAASLEDADRMIQARNRAGSFVAVGYQWSFAGSILRLKRDILAGKFGAPKSGKCLTLWPRAEGYYSRNDWAGKERDTAGRPIFDSPANNAMAHYLHNLLFLLGEAIDRSAEPAEVESSLSRVNEIETFDTVAAKFRLASGPDLLFLASHAIGEHETVEPRFQLNFEGATIDFPGKMAPMTARFNDGQILEYPSPNSTHHTRKLWACLNALAGESQVPCGLETARPHVQCIEMLHGTEQQVHVHSENELQRTETPDGMLRWVEGLAQTLETGYAKGEVPWLTSR